MARDTSSLMLPVTRRQWNRPAVVALVLVTLGLAVLPLDLAVARHFTEGRIPGPVHDLLAIAEVMGNPLGVLFVGWIIWLLIPHSREWVFRFCAAAFGAGLASNAMKLLIARTRPLHFDLQQSFGGVSDTFQSVLPFGEGWPAQSSFPSGHTALAFGAAFALAQHYRRARLPFVILAASTGLQRVVSQYHYLSDVFVGSGVGWLMGAVCYHRAGLVWEALVKRRQERSPSAATPVATWTARASMDYEGYAVRASASARSPRLPEGLTAVPSS